MKTIDEAAKNSFDRISIYGADTNEEDFKGGFRIGVEFAQRWIPIEEELPIKQGCYLVKCKNSFPKNCDVVVAEFYEDNHVFYSESSDYPIKDATHWRPIERK